MIQFVRVYYSLGTSDFQWTTMTEVFEGEKSIDAVGRVYQQLDEQHGNGMARLRRWELVSYEPSEC